MSCGNATTKYDLWSSDGTAAGTLNRTNVGYDQAPGVLHFGDDELYFMGYTDLADQPLDPLDLRREGTHLEALRQHFPELATRFFQRFGNQ